MSHPSILQRLRALSCVVALILVSGILEASGPAEPKKSLGRSGKLDFTIDYVKAVDDQKLNLRSTREIKGTPPGTCGASSLENKEKKNDGLRTQLR